MWNVQSKLGSSTSRRGFTMVEVLIVVVIIGILSGIAVPQFLRSTAESSLDGDASTFFLELQKLKSTAVRSGNHARMTIVNATAEEPLKWTIEQYDPVSKNYGKPKAFTASRKDVKLGLPDEVLSPREQALLMPFFAGMSDAAPSGGLYAGLAPAGTGVNQCIENSSSDVESWVDGKIESCGGAVGDMETGMLCMHTTKSDSRAYCFLFNRSTSLALLQFRYMGGTWEKL